jgi:hypothetical protein
LPIASLGSGKIWLLATTKKNAKIDKIYALSR